jgi:hypothetical protein
LNFEKVDKWIEAQHNPKKITIRQKIPGFEKFKLEIGPSQRKTIRLYYSRRGRACYILLGEYPYVRFAEAFERGVRKMNEKSITGQKPKSAYTFMDLRREFITYARNILKLKDTTLTTYEKRINKHIVPRVGRVPIEDLTLDALRENLFNSLESEPVANSKTYYILKNFFIFAKKKGYISINPLANFKFTDEYSLPSKKSHHRKIINPSDLRDFLVSVCSLKNIEKKRYIIFTLLTALRAMNLSDLRLNYVNFEKKTLHIPKQEMKGMLRTEEERQDLILPLSNLAVKILLSMKKANSEKFFHQSANTINDALKSIAGVTRHGLRGTFKTFATKNIRTHRIPNFVIELYQHHVPQMSRTEESYLELRYDDHEIQDMLRELADWWEKYLLGLFDFREALEI